MTHAWKKTRAKAAKHAALMRRLPELRGALYGSNVEAAKAYETYDATLGHANTVRSQHELDTSAMTPEMRRLWERPIERPNALQRARDREIGLDKLYPPATRATAKKDE